MKYIFGLLAVVLAPPALGMQTANICDQAAVEAAQSFDIPPRVMLAIARVESGRTINGIEQPWPWAVNVAGASHWFDTATEAHAFVQDQIEIGNSNIDVGCFQLNLHWHANDFSSLEEMFDPAANANYAAQFLNQNYRRKGNWVDAVAAYHSNTPEHAENYIAKVESVLTDLADGAKSAQPITLQPIETPNRFPLLQRGAASSMASLVPRRDTATPLLIAAP